MSLKLQLHTSQGYGDTHTDTCAHTSPRAGQTIAAASPNGCTSTTTTVTSAQTLAHPQVAPRIEQRRRERFYRAVILSNTPTPTPSHTHSLSHCRRPSTKLGIFLSFFLWRSLTGGCRPTSTTPWGERGAARGVDDTLAPPTVCECVSE